MNAFLIAALVKSTLVLFATALLLVALSRASAASRHLIAVVGLSGALAVPLLGLVLPRLEVPLLPAPARRPSVARRAQSVPSPKADGFQRSSGLVGVQMPSREDEGLPAKAAIVPASFGVDASRIAIALWLVGGLVPLLALALGFRRARALVGAARPVDDRELELLAADVSERLGLSRPVPILLSTEVSVPMTAGLLRPVLVLPESARAWPTERQRVVLLHELAHVARRDLGALLVAELARAAYWFHPLAHLVAGRLRRAAEEASDDLVLGNGTRASDYASHLVGIVRGLAAPSEMPVLAMARPSDLEERVRAILDPSRRRTRPSRFLTAALSAAGIVGALVLGAAVPGVARTAMAASLPIVDEPPSLPAVAPTARTVAVEHTQKIATIVLVGNRKGGKESGSEAYERGRELHEDERYLEAAAEFVKAVDLGYREDTAAYNAACAYARAGRKDDAFTWLNKSIELGFDVGSYLRRDDDLDSLRDDPRFAELKKAAKAAKANENAAASARAVKRFEKLGADGSKSGAKWYAVGKELLDVDQFGPSEKAFRMAAKLGYREGASTYNAACALARAGQKAQALDTLDAALEVGFDDPKNMERDDDLESLHDQPRFAALKKKAEDLSLSGFDIGSGLSRLFARRSAWRSEVPNYVAYAKAHPESGRAQYNVGYAQLLGDRPEAAVAAFTRALELGYRKPTTLYNLACSHARLDEKDKAFERLFQAIDAGVFSRDQIRNDDDLDSLHGDPRFRKALERAAAKDDDDES